VLKVLFSPESSNKSYCPLAERQGLSDGHLSQLQVVFTSGRVYCYQGVPPEVFRGLLEAESKGQYMRAHIIDVYPYRRGPCRK